MLLTGGAPAFQPTLSWSVEPSGQRLEIHRHFLVTNRAIASQVEAKFQAFRMKTPRPLKLVRELKVVPLDAEARLVKAPVERSPAGLDWLPDRGFPEA